MEILTPARPVHLLLIPTYVNIAIFIANSETAIAFVNKSKSYYKFKYRISEPLYGNGGRTVRQKMYILYHKVHTKTCTAHKTLY